VHSQCDDITWTREAPTCKVTGPDGYKYEPLWIHTSEAENRDIQSGDVVKVFNERGIVLVGAYVTERLRPGVVYVDHGARHDPIIPVKSSAAAPSTPFRPPERHLRIALGKPPAATWSRSKKSPAKSGNNGAETIPKPLTDNTIRMPGCAWMPGSMEVTTHEGICHRPERLQRLLLLPDRV
jgi:anaerobic selenocysteine-containing dehydrogenase